VNAVAKTIRANAVANDGTVEGDPRRVGILKLIWSIPLNVDGEGL
jgi:hypothetical protein